MHSIVELHFWAEMEKSSKDHMALQSASGPRQQKFLVFQSIFCRTFQTKIFASESADMWCIQRLKMSGAVVSLSKHVWYLLKTTAPQISNGAAFDGWNYENTSAAIAFDKSHNCPFSFLYIKQKVCEYERVVYVCMYLCMSQIGIGRINWSGPSFVWMPVKWWGFRPLSTEDSILPIRLLIISTYWFFNHFAQKSVRTCRFFINFLQGSAKTCPLVFLKCWTRIW